MTTTVADSVTQPAITMNKLHIDSFLLKHARESSPKRVIGMSIVKYGLDADGNKVFDKETISVNDGDFDATVITAALTSGQTIEEFAAQYVADKAAVDAEIVTGITDTKLMAYFELALARIAELHNKVVISGVE